MFLIWFIFFADGFFADGLCKNNIFVWTLFGISPIAIVFIFDSLILSSCSYLILKKTTDLNYSSIGAAKYLTITILFRYLYTIICTFINGAIWNLLYEHLALSFVLKILVILLYFAMFFITNIAVFCRKSPFNKKVLNNLIAFSIISAPWFIFISLSR